MDAPKWYEMHQNVSLASNGVDRVRLWRKIWTRLRGTNFCTSSECSAPSFTRQPNGRECTKTVRNAPKHEFRFQWGALDAFVAKKNPTRLRATNFSTSSARFAMSFVRQPNCPKWIQMVRNAPKHEFRLPWCGSGAFVAENSDATSWHELLH